MLMGRQFHEEIAHSLICILDRVLFSRAVHSILRFFMLLAVGLPLQLARLSEVWHACRDILVRVPAPFVVQFIVLDRWPAPLALARGR